MRDGCGVGSVRDGCGVGFVRDGCGVGSSASTLVEGAKAIKAAIRPESTNL